MAKKYKYRKRFTFNNKTYSIYANTLEEIGQKKILKIQELQQKQVKEKNLTVAEYVPQCIERYKIGQSESTRKDYQGGIKKGIIDPCTRQFVK